MIKNGDYYLITVNEWFIAPDGEEYRAAWGKCKIVDIKDCFGFVPLRPSTNWFCEIGEGENSIIIAGCHIHYAIKCTQKPIIKTDTYIHDTTKTAVVLNKIYLTE